VPVDGDVAAFRLLAAPRQPPGAVGVVDGFQFSVAASQQNAASSRATATATVPAGLPRFVARCIQPVQALLAAPGDLNDAGILA
jgi:hypothetical protein